MHAPFSDSVDVDSIDGSTAAQICRSRVLGVRTEECTITCHSKRERNETTNEQAVYRYTLHRISRWRHACRRYHVEVDARELRRRMRPAGPRIKPAARLQAVPNMHLGSV